MKLTLNSGAYVDPRNFNADKITLGDIGIALHNMPRFCGQPDLENHFTQQKIYSVAEHSINMMMYFRDKGTPELAYAALWHDAAEAFTGDIPTPIKHALSIKARTELANLEKKILAELAIKWQFRPMCDEVKRVDYAFCYAEAVWFFGPEIVRKNFEPSPIPIEQINPYLKFHYHGAWLEAVASFAMKKAATNAR